MFKKCVMIFAGVLLCAGSFCAAELNYTRNRVSFGKTRINILNGNFSITDDKAGLLVYLYPHFTTNGKGTWFSMGAKSCNPKRMPADDKCYKVVSSVPVNAAEKMTVTQDIAVTPFNALDVTVEMGKIKNNKDLREQAFFFSMPLKNLGPKQSFLLNGKEIVVKNETKYGWYSAVVENPVFTLFPGVSGREFTLAFPGKATLSFGTAKNGSVTIRVILLQNPMRCTITPK